VRDDELEDPEGCTDPWTGETLPRGTAVVVPFGYPMGPVSPPGPYVGGPAGPTMSMYVCENGRWVGVLSYREDLIELLSDEVSVAGLEGSAVMTGSCRCAGETAIELSASVGSIELDEEGTWTWQLAPDDGPVDDQVVVITATAGDRTTKGAFELTGPERSAE